MDFNGMEYFGIGVFASAPNEELLFRALTSRYARN